jgi:hypothetical protein
MLSYYVNEGAESVGTVACGRVVIVKASRITKDVLLGALMLFALILQISKLIRNRLSTSHSNLQHIRRMVIKKQIEVSFMPKLNRQSLGKGRTVVLNFSFRNHVTDSVINTAAEANVRTIITLSD